MKFRPVVDAKKLLEKDHPEFVFADIRTGPDAKKVYEEGHLPNAIFFDLETMLASKNGDPAIGGRHPLPTPEDFCKLLGKAGITPSTTVIAYDDKSGANAAARFWWMMRAIGHEHVCVLNGGISSALDAGFILDNKIPERPTSEYPCPGEWLLPLISIEEAVIFSTDPNKMLIDVRDAKRYNGETEPIDRIAGHIPGAINYPFVNNLDESGKFKDQNLLKQEYLQLLQGKAATDVAIHCGSGVTACHTILAMVHAGLGIPSLYVGSWSEWSEAGREVATNM